MSFMAKQGGIPSLNLRNYDIDTTVARLVSKRFATERRAIPIDRLGRLLTLAMACPLDDDTVRDVSTLTGLKTRPVLADADDIQWGIERFLHEAGEPEIPGVEEDIPRSTGASPDLCPVAEAQIKQMIQQIEALPLTPGSLYLLRQATAEGPVSEEALTRLVAMDPLMTARLLALANAEAHHHSGKVDSARQAIRMLGAPKASMLVSATDTAGLFSHWERFDLYAYWTDAVCCAKAASIIAEKCNMAQPDRFYTAGLLHDIGRVALCEILPTHYQQIGMHATGMELLVREKDIVGLPHTLAGYELAIAWRFPDEFAQGIMAHHFPERAHASSNLVAVVCIANVMADRARSQTPLDDSDIHICQTAMNMISLTEPSLRSIYDDVVARMPDLFAEDSTRYGSAKANA